MAQRGVWQLKKLLVAYCDISGSSAGARAFVKEALPEFAAQNPQLEVQTQLARGLHPQLQGLFVSTQQRKICMRNATPEEILKQAIILRSGIGRNPGLRIQERVISRQKSIQGSF
eukprot:jgi/Astpho2/3582/gw1.00058.62.1_t